MTTDKQPKEYIIIQRDKVEIIQKTLNAGITPDTPNDVITMVCNAHRILLDAPVSTPPIPDSTHLIEMAKTEWKNREERRGIHNREDWCCGWMAGFLSVDKPDWVKLHEGAAPEPETCWECRACDETVCKFSINCVGLKNAKPNKCPSNMPYYNPVWIEIYQGVSHDTAIAQAAREKALKDLLKWREKEVQNDVGWDESWGNETCHIEDSLRQPKEQS